MPSLERITLAKKPSQKFKIHRYLKQTLVLKEVIFLKKGGIPMKTISTMIIWQGSQAKIVFEELNPR